MSFIATCVSDAAAVLLYIDRVPCNDVNFLVDTNTSVSS